MTDKKWICNKCGFETREEPDHKNATCQNCGRGRFKTWILCNCGEWFHSDRATREYCSNECKYKYRPKDGKKGKHYPHLQRARVAVCPVCGKEFRAVKDYGDRLMVYCSKECWTHRGKKTKGKCRDPKLWDWKKAVFTRDKWTCQWCGSKENLEAHHIKEKRNFPELKYEVSNGMCLCHKCHRGTDNYGSKAKAKA